MSPKVWLITGTSSGFGRAVTEHVLKSGDIVVATLRSPAALSDLQKEYPASKLLILQLDVADSAAIPKVFSKAIEAFGRVDVVFNNAGYGSVGVAETTPTEAARRQFDVNFWGTVNVSREAIRVFREVNSPPGGRLLQNSSIAVWSELPAMSYYVATKTALEGFTESLAAEVDPEWNINITIIEPGGFQTSGLESLVVQELPAAYIKPGSPVSQVSQWMQSKPEFQGDPVKGAAVIYKVATLPEPPLRFPLGKDAVEAAKKYGEKLLQEVTKYESWSEGTERQQQTVI